MALDTAVNATTQPNARKQIVTYLGLTFTLSAILWALIIRAGSINNEGGLLTLILMWVPGISAIITSLIYRRSLRGLGWKLGKAKYLGLAYALPILYGLIVYGIAWLTGLAGFGTANLPDYGPWPIYLVITSTLIFLAGSLPSALGEEIGWRGLLVPQLTNASGYTKAAFISGGIWTLWHMPLILFADYHSEAPIWFGLICFTIMVIGISFPFAWLRLKSGSLWPAAVLHASHNLFIQVVFDPLSVNTGSTPYITTEFGAGLALAGIILGLIFWQLGRRDPEITNQA